MPRVHTYQNTSPAIEWVYQLKSRNPLLFWFGMFNLVFALICLVMAMVTDVEVLGINAYFKPAKFFLSIAILGFTMSWYMVYLNSKKAVKLYSWVMIITMLVEMSIILWQASNGRLSHFNISSQFHGNLFKFMGIAIVTFTLWTLYIGILFFRQNNFPPDLPQGYIWGIRLGILCFVIFAFEGGHMVSLLAHTVGAPDGGEGLPFVNWSKANGDLRVPHFFGMHALQVLPLMGYYLARTKTRIFLLAITWFLFTAILYWQAVLGYPVIP